METIPHNYFAFLSNEVYKSGNYITPSGWTFSRNSNYYDLSKHGYFGAVFRKGDNIIIAHRGTDGITDLGDDIALYISRSKTQQFNDCAKPFTEAVIQDLSLEKDISNFNVYHTGHSLGGFLAQMCAHEFNSQAISFDNPGTFETIGNSNSIEYLTAPNKINTAKTHGGNIKRIYPKYNIHQSGNDYMDYIFSSAFTNQQHNMDNIVLCFNPSTGLPRTYSQPTSWPSDGKSWFENYALNPHYWNLYFDSKGWDRAKRIDYIENDLKSSYLSSTAQMPRIYSDGTAKDLWMTSLNVDFIETVSGKETVYNYGGQTSLIPKAGLSNDDISVNNHYIISSLDNSVIGDGVGINIYEINQQSLGKVDIYDRNPDSTLKLIGKSSETLSKNEIKCLTDLEGNPIPDMLVLGNHKVSILNEVYNPINGEYV